MKIPVSELIVNYMEMLGIEYIFGMPGAHILPVYDSLYHPAVTIGQAPFCHRNTCLMTSLLRLSDANLYRTRNC